MSAAHTVISYCVSFIFHLFYFDFTVWFCSTSTRLILSSPQQRQRRLFYAQRLLTSYRETPVMFAVFAVNHMEISSCRLSRLVNLSLLWKMSSRPSDLWMSSSLTIKVASPLCPQVIWDSSVSVLVHIRAAEPVRHQREGPARVHGVHRGDHVRDVQRHLAGGSAQHAHRHDEQLLPAHRCKPRQTVPRWFIHR